ncbi:MAG: ATP-binding cassette domain-containing protein [Phycisphaerae bacterium]|nr:ATP-binding cassette domain-containing protein [Phycisphaerae bacterium]
MTVVRVDQLTKSFRVPAKEAGLLPTLRHFLRRQYRTVEAVKEVSFTIEPGEFVGFLGPNGAGKTTTLKMLTGLIHPTAGSVEVAGHVPFRRRPEFLNRITLVMGQKQQLIWDLPALDSLKINAAVYEIPEPDFRSRLAELSEMLDLNAQLTQPVRKLSLGERMKAELLAALLHRPSVLFLDEPTLGLDVNAQAAVRNFLREYNRRHHATVLLTSHYMADITALCPRVLLIHRGQLIYDGSIAGIIDRFAPYREIKIELDAPIPHDLLQRYGEVRSVQDRMAQIIVRRDELTAVVSRLLNEQKVCDLTVTDPPIDDIIGRLFKEGIVA